MCSCYVSATPQLLLKYLIYPAQVRVLLPAAHARLPRARARAPQALHRPEAAAPAYAQQATP